MGAQCRRDTTHDTDACLIERLKYTVLSPLTTKNLVLYCLLLTLCLGPASFSLKQGFLLSALGGPFNYTFFFFFFYVSVSCISNFAVPCLGLAYETVTRLTDNL